MFIFIRRETAARSVPSSKSSVVCGEGLSCRKVVLVIVNELSDIPGSARGVITVSTWCHSHVLINNANNMIRALPAHQHGTDKSSLIGTMVLHGGISGNENGNESQVTSHEQQSYLRMFVFLHVSCGLVVSVSAEILWCSSPCSASECGIQYICYNVAM